MIGQDVRIALPRGRERTVNWIAGRVVAVAGLMLAVALLSYAAGGVVCANPVTTPAPVVKMVGPGSLGITGGIDKRMVAALKSTLASAHAPIRRILLNSFGGDTDQMTQIAAILLPFHATTEVPDHATCQSACVGLLAHASGPVVVAPTAKLMFHSAAIRFGLASHGPCGLINNITVSIDLGGRWLAATALDIARELLVPIASYFRWDSVVSFLSPAEPAMLPWARRLTPQLPILFELCKHNPLRTTRGMFLTGAEFNGLRDGTIAPARLVPRCPDT